MLKSKNSYKKISGPFASGRRQNGSYWKQSLKRYQEKLIVRDILRCVSKYCFVWCDNFDNGN